MAGRRRLPKRNPRQTEQQMKSMSGMTARRTAANRARVAKAKPSPGLLRAQGATPKPAMAPRPNLFSGTQAKRAEQNKARMAGAKSRATQRLKTKPTVNPGYQLKAQKTARRPSGISTPKPFKPMRLGRGRRRRLR